MTKKLLMVTACLMMFTFLFACIPSRKHTRPEPDINPLQRQLSETNEKVNQLYHRVSMIQLMADNHQKTIQELENKLKESEIKLAAVSSMLDKTPKASTAPLKTPRFQPPTYPPTPVAVAPATPQGPSGAIKLYREALSTFRKNEFGEAEKLFSNFLNQFPDDQLADNALYWSGECHYAQKNFADAVLKFKDVVNRFPQGSKVPDALLKIGFAYYSMGDKEQAKNFLKKVVTNYPFSTAGAKAEEKLLELQR